MLAESPDATDPLDYAAGVHVGDVDLIQFKVVAADEQRVAGRVCPGEARVGGEGAPCPADQAEAAELLGLDTEEHLAQHVRGQDAVVGSKGISASYERRRHRSPAGR